MIFCPKCGEVTGVLHTEGAERTLQCMNPDCNMRYKSVETITAELKPKPPPQSFNMKKRSKWR